MVDEVFTGPVRVCCGQRHQGAICPDGLVMCCLCFTRVPVSDLYVDSQHDRWDICTTCQAYEEQQKQAHENRRNAP